MKQIVCSSKQEVKLYFETTVNGYLHNIFHVLCFDGIYLVYIQVGIGPFKGILVDFVGPTKQIQSLYIT